MRTLLFVQSGDARPKVRPTSGAALATIIGGKYGDWLKDIVLGYDRWWLVECENAEAGRTLIYLREAISAAHRYMGSKEPERGTAAVCGDVPRGRILASGGRAA